LTTSKTICFAGLGMAGAIAGGLLAAYVDSINDEVQATILVVLATAFAAGAVCPKLAWLGAVLIALCLTLICWRKGLLRKKRV
jgi:hypothetical protein